MNIVEAIKKAIETNNAGMAGGISDFLRFKHGMTYDQIFSVVEKAKLGYSPADWDALLYESEI